MAYIRDKIREDMTEAGYKWVLTNIHEYFSSVKEIRKMSTKGKEYIMCTFIN